MARPNKGGGAGPARIRFVVLEAELPDGDLSQVTQAVQNALRPVDGNGSVRRVISGPAKPPTSDMPPVENLRDEEIADLDEMEEAPTQEAKRPRSASKPRSPEVINVELKLGDMPFAKFADQKKPSSHNMKNLVVAAWFKLYRETDVISMDHVYTCYRAVNWPSGMEDFGITLRKLKAQKLVDSKGKGFYAINHIGLNKVEELG